MKRKPMTEEERQALNAATRESWSLNDPRANYPLAETAREARREGRERADA